MKHIVFVLQEIILEIGIKKVETKITITNATGFSGPALLG